MIIESHALSNYITRGIHMKASISDNKPNTATSDHPYTIHNYYFQSLPFNLTREIYVLKGAESDFDNRFFVSITVFAKRHYAAKRLSYARYRMR